MKGEAHPYVLFMLVLSILSLIGIAASTSGHLGRDEVQVLQAADLVLCSLFLFDFLLTLYRSPNRLHYFLRWGWLDLLSAVPMVDALRITRGARILRLIRLLRAAKATRSVGRFILERRTEGGVLAVALLSLLLVVSASIAILQLETAPNSNILSGEDALWWSISTITTVGYGDRFPVTSEGRLLASCLMVSGVGLFGALSGLIASWFLRPAERAQSGEVALLVAEIRELRLQLEMDRNR
jgi:voltage-gated potassium channel